MPLVHTGRRDAYLDTSFEGHRCQLVYINIVLVGTNVGGAIDKEIHVYALAVRSVDAAHPVHDGLRRHVLLCARLGRSALMKEGIPECAFDDVKPLCLPVERVLLQGGIKHVGGLRALLVAEIFAERADHIEVGQLLALPDLPNSSQLLAPRRLIR